MNLSSEPIERKIKDLEKTQNHIYDTPEVQVSKTIFERVEGFITGQND